MAGGVALTVGARQGIDEVRRIGNNQIEPAIGLEIVEIGTNHLYPIGPGRTGHVLGRLRSGRGVYLDRRHAQMGVALGQLEGDKARACAYVERRMCYAVGAHLHGAAVVVYNKLFKQKRRVGHIGCGYCAAKISERRRNNACESGCFLSF